jgi:hypothetical protein
VSAETNSAAPLRRALICAAAVAWSLAATAQADDAPPKQSSAPAAAQKKPDPRDQIVCREEQEIGSLISRKRVCHTKREWDQISADARQQLDANQVSQSLPR